MFQGKIKIGSVNRMFKKGVVVALEEPELENNSQNIMVSKKKI